MVRPNLKRANTLENNQEGRLLARSEPKRAEVLVTNYNTGGRKSQVNEIT